MHRISKLKNGTTLITVPVKGTKATTVLAMFPVGSRYETKKLSGASHFVEHMLFKGTKKRPGATDISRVLERVGADYNAFTNKDYTGYYVKIDGSKQDIAYDLLSDMIYNSKIEEVEVEKEKGAIVEELRMYADNPTMAIDVLFERALFGDCPLGWDIGGSEQTVRAISRLELWRYYQEHYSPRNMVLVVAGDVGSKKLNKLFPLFGSQQAPGKARPLSFYKKGFQKVVWPAGRMTLDKRVMIKEKKLDQAHLMLGFPGLPNNHPDRYATSVLLNILGSGMSSRLFVEVREKRGLAYMIRSSSSSYRDVGTVSVQAGLDPARLSEALQVIKAELQRLADEPVTAEELADAKTNIAGHMALSLEDSSNQAEWYARHFLFGTTIETPEQVVLKYKKVTIKDVQRMAKQLFDFKHMRLAAIGSVPKNTIIKML